MATLEEMRRWLQGEDVEGLPKHKPSGKRGEGNSLDIGKVGKRRRDKNLRWRSIRGGTDAVLLFGKFNGRKVSEMIKEPSGYSYLEWIVLQSFPNELKRIINEYMRASIDR